MKLYELMKISSDLLEILSKNGILVKDVRYIEFYSDYFRMREEGYKVFGILEELCRKYHISESKARRLIRKLSQDI